jgi:hypothetical protein
MELAHRLMVTDPFVAQSPVVISIDPPQLRKARMS